MAGLWLAGELTEHAEHFLLVDPVGVPVSMVVFGWVLYRAQRPLRGHARRPREPAGRSAWLVSSSDERGRCAAPAGRARCMDMSMTASAVAALVLMTVWFFFLAEAPLAPLP